MDYVDIIHGRIVLPESIASIIKTAQFQRLKNIHQLGIYHLAFPKANHTRFEHCIGTYHLANKAIDCLEKNTKDLHVPDFYREAVGIAALLHDVGHGPFSHSWESVCNEYKHEEMASSCIDEIFEEVSIDWTDKEYALKLIKALIVGNPSCLRDKEYGFLFEIVNNKQCNVDVDKWDYLKRDLVKMEAGVVLNKDFEDVFMNARASDDRAHIEYRYNDYPLIYNIFEMRAGFHINFYQKPMLICVEQILKYVVTKARNLEHIDGFSILDVRSKHTQAFLKFDEDAIWRILRAIKSPPEVTGLVRVLENCSLLKEIHPVTTEEKDSVPEYLKVAIEVNFAGEEMKEEKIFFYGDKSKKPKIEKRMGTHKSTSYFEISS